MGLGKGIMGRLCLGIVDPGSQLETAREWSPWILKCLKVTQCYSDLVLNKNLQPPKLFPTWIFNVSHSTPNAREATKVSLACGKT